MAANSSGALAANTHRDVRFESLYEFAGPGAADEHLERHLDVVPDVAEGEPALQTCYGQAYYLVAGSGDFLHLHLAVGSHEKDFGVGIDLLETVGY